MIKKIFIAVLVLVVIGAVSVSVYNTTLARAGQAEPELISSSQVAVVDAIQDESALPSVVTAVDAQNSTGENLTLTQPPIQQSAGFGSGNAQRYNLPPATLGDLSDAEQAALVYMREEEKLAHDVYLTLYGIWQLPTFQNIASSEQTHMDSVKLLLDRYGIADVATAEVGKFTNPDLQALYNSLVERGSQSLAEAIKVGGAIEEIDILDLQERLAQVDNADIQQVFNNLLQGSINHLNAFVTALQNQTGETYQPQYMSLEAFQAILSSTTGGGYGRGGGQGGAGGGYRGGRP